MQQRDNRRKGQALIMVTLALITMFGIMGLAVDSGWSFYIRKSQRAAADAAAIAAAQRALDLFSGTFACDSTTMACQQFTNCPGSITRPLSSNLMNGCVYAQANGYTTGANSGRQTVEIAANVPAASCGSVSPPNCVPNAPGVRAYYWVTVRVTETIPQLFSAVLGNTVGTVSTEATAAITDSVVIGSLILTNREGDRNPNGLNGTGTNLNSQGGGTVYAPGGVLLASQCNGTNCAAGNTNNFAGYVSGSGTVTADFTYVQGVGQACAGNLTVPGCSGVGQSQWTVPPTGGGLGDPMFQDPMAGKGQPPVTTTPLTARPILNGTISGGNRTSPTILYPGNYYAVNSSGTATGAQISLGSGYFQFANDGGTIDGTGLGHFVFYGGLQTSSGNAVVTFTPGQYVFAGQNPNQNGQAAGSLFYLSNGTVVQDFTPAGQTQTDPGELFVFTNVNSSYFTNDPGLSTQFQQLPAGAQSTLTSTLQFGTSGVKMGNNDNSQITLHGLNKTNSLIAGTDLEPFAPTVFWQDQQNSYVQYTSSGNVVCGNNSSTCLNTATNLSPEMDITAGANIHLFGSSYQPRGAYMVIGGSSNIQGNRPIPSVPLQIITGAVTFSGGPSVILTSPTDPSTRRVVALVE